MRRPSLHDMLRRRRAKAGALVHFSQARNERGHMQLCLYATCLSAETTVGPIWGHSGESLKRALATLTAECDCPAKYHRALEFEGHRIGV